MEFTEFNRIVDSMVKASTALDKTHEIGIDLLDFIENYNITIHLLLNEYRLKVGKTISYG